MTIFNLNLPFQFSPYSLIMPSPNLMCFFYNSLTPVSAVHMCVCRAFHWSLGNLRGTISQYRMVTIHCQQLTSQLGVGTWKPLLLPCSIDLVQLLHGNHSCYELMVMVAMACPEAAFVFPLLKTPTSFISLFVINWMILFFFFFGA